VTAVVAGDVQLMFAGAPSALPQVSGGKLRALAVASPKRIAAAPALPTLDESGLPGFDVTSWYSIVAPAGTPPAIVERLQNEIARALDNPGVRTKLAALGAEPIANSPADFAAMIKSETAKWSKIVKDANIKPE
jgi:tripartite-type tricarboxylate transporter receptor subunit TctC